jgi:predicted nucleic acid-binding protein
VDTNILVDLVTDDPIWTDWSVRQMDLAAARGKIFINDVIYAEFSVRFDKVETVDALIAKIDLVYATIPRAALFMAGKAFQRYRVSGGIRTSILSDFFIGAHAAVAGIPLLTRDIQPYKTYFPTLNLISPHLA